MLLIFTLVKRGLATLALLTPDPETRKQLERGQGLVEYALILVLIAVVSIIILTVLGDQVTEMFLTSEESLNCVLENGPDCILDD